MRIVHRGLALTLALAATLVSTGACTRGSSPPAPRTGDGGAAAAPAAQPLRGRAAHTATALADGRVLIAGGCDSDGCGSAQNGPSTELYTPGKGFSAGPPMRIPRDSHTATPLADGRILIVGGFTGEGKPPLADAEVFDPRTGAFAPAGTLHTARGGHAAVRLADGRVLIAGGWIGYRTYTNTVEIFDPATNTFSPAPSMPQVRMGPAAVALADGRILLAGGQDGPTHGLASALMYLPDHAQWQPVAPMGTPRFKHTIASLPDGRALVLGGTPDDRQLLDSTEVFDPATGRFTAGPAMSVPRYKISAVAVTSRALVVAAGARVDAYDLSTGKFKPLTDPGPVRWAPSSTGLADGSVLIIGGYDEGIRVHRDALIVRP